MQQQTVSARVNLNPYTNKVLGIVKLKFDLENKSEALNKFIDLYGDEIIEKESTDEYAKKVMEIADDHFKKHGNRKMNKKELDALFGK